MPLLKSWEYAKDPKKKIYYQGKFIIKFNVMIMETTSNINKKITNEKTCYVNIYFTDVEAKYNMTVAKSILESDLTNVTIKKYHNIDLTL